MTGQAKAWATAVLLAAALAAGDAPARAQAIPEGQSCGGLLCDMGVLGHKSEPAPAAVAPVTVPAAAPSFAETAPAARSRPLRPRKNIVASPATRHPAVPRQVERPTPASAPVVAKAPAPVAAPRAAVARPGFIAPPTEPATAMQMPAPKRPIFYFQSVDPTLR